MIEITVNRRQMRELKAFFAEAPRELQTVLSRAINKVGVTARKRIIDIIAQQIAVKKSDLRNRNVTLRRATYRDLMANIVISGRRIPIFNFGARQTKKGVTYRISRSGGRKTALGAFMESYASGTPIQMRSGHRGVFRRRQLEGHELARLPIEEIFGPSVPVAAENISALTEASLNNVIGSRLEKEITTQVGVILQRHRRSA